MKQKFRNVRLSKENKKRLDLINSIIEEYQEQGYKLTLRQLYYQLVSRDVVPNKVAEYAKLSNLLKEGRMGGIVDWAAIEDRLRVPSTPGSWEDPKDILRTAVNAFAMPRMKGQANYLEVWVEKDALSGVLSRVTRKYHVPILVNRGYSSVSAMYDSYQRFKAAIENGQKCNIIYLGDFDPSGVDMIRDIRARILEFLFNCEELRALYFDLIDSDHEDYDEAKDPDYNSDFIDFRDAYAGPESIEIEDYELSFYAWIEFHFKIDGVALTRAQINQYNPPKNPAKITDPRAAKFIAEHGSSSWEVDALKPEVLHRLLESSVIKRIDLDKYNEIVKLEQRETKKLEIFIDKYE